MKKDDDKTKEQLIDELGLMRQRVAELERAIEEQDSAEETRPEQGIKLSNPSAVEVYALIQELETHQHELEVQNEELQVIQQQLEEARSKYTDLYDFAPVGYFILDREGLIREVNLTGAAQLGESRGQLLRQKFTNYVAWQDQDLFYLHHRYAFNKETPQAIEAELIKKDGTPFYARLESVVVPDSRGSRNYLRIAIIDITERKQMEIELAEVQRRLMESREAERIRLAQELHDGPIQDLYSISYHLKAVGEAIPDEADLQTSLRQVIQTLRTICQELRPPVLIPFGLGKAIRSHNEQYFQTAHPELVVQLELMSDEQTLPERTRLALFRIYQESLNNIIQHARANHIWVRFKLETEQVILEIEDDGRGFEVPRRWLRLARLGHLGLIGAMERAEAVGGHLDIISKPSNGTLIRAVVPHMAESEAMHQSA